MVDRITTVSASPCRLTEVDFSVTFWLYRAKNSIAEKCCQSPNSPPQLRVSLFTSAITGKKIGGRALRATEHIRGGPPVYSVMPQSANGEWVPYIGNVTSYTQKGKLIYSQVKQEQESQRCFLVGQWTFANFILFIRTKSQWYLYFSPIRL